MRKQVCRHLIKLALLHSQLSQRRVLVHLPGQAELLRHGEARRAEGVSAEYLQQIVVRAPAGDGSRKDTDAAGVTRFERLVPGEHKFKLDRKGGSGSFTYSINMSVSGSDNQSAQEPADAGWETVVVADGGSRDEILRRPEGHLEGFALGQAAGRDRRYRVRVQGG